MLPFLATPVEDSPFIVKLTTRMLTSQGHAVESALNGSAGLDRLRAVFGTNADFDLVLCDFQMPIMDGFECVRRYRQFERSSVGCDTAASGTVTATDASSSVASTSASNQQVERRPDMVIVGMSANSDLGSQSLALDAGMDEFLPKPFSGAELQRIISQFG
jgi:CheY-like chemotaxis protein